MPVYKTKVFARFARKAGIRDRELRNAAAEVARGNYDADLGGGVYKQRIARPGAGKSGGFRTILCFREGSHTFFVYGFTKSVKANITADELKTTRKLAAQMLAYGAKEIGDAMHIGELIEVMSDEDDPKA
ncbi:MAG TPA: type II toxin-antitoxin system RelE/ParE family toxin [Beijerinckiaceae bacterium]|jgi:hypothetical protein